MNTKDEIWQKKHWPRHMCMCVAWVKNFVYVGGENSEYLTYWLLLYWTNSLLLDSCLIVNHATLSSFYSNWFSHIDKNGGESQFSIAILNNKLLCRTGTERMAQLPNKILKPIWVEIWKEKSVLLCFYQYILKSKSRNFGTNQRSVYKH